MELTATPPPTSPLHLRRPVLTHLLAAVCALLAVALPLGPALDLPGTYAVFCLLAFLPAAWFALTRLDLHRAPEWGHANRVTLLRSVLLALVGGSLPFVHDLDAMPAWALSVIAVTALVLDGVDGWLARRQGLCSPYGARFDMEMDTVAILYLCLLLWLSGEVGGWVLLAGLLRPLFVVAGRVWPWLDNPLPFSQRRRLICMVQVGVLALCATPLLGPPLTGFAVGAALALLLFSFTVDTVWLHSHRHDGGGTNNG